jgi:uncharacterized membrane protein
MSETTENREISIWFFCGILMLAYGIVLVITLHPTLWWGAFLGLGGAFYTVRFRPGRA